MYPPLTMLVYPGQHSKWRVGVLNLLKPAIIKAYFPWYQRNSSEKQATELWGILSIKYWLAAAAAMKSWKWINIYSILSTFIGTCVKFPFSELSKGHKITWKGSGAGQSSLFWEGKNGRKTNQLLPCSLVKSYQCHIMISVNTEKVKVSAFTRYPLTVLSAGHNMVPKPRGNLAKELQEA